jgi:tetratricopeptide (TPR) repeat protein
MTGHWSLRGARIHRHVLRVLASGLVIAGCAQTALLAAESRATLPPPVEAFEIGAVKASTGGLLLSGQAGGNVDGALTWSLAGRDASGRVEVPYVIEVDGRALLSGGGGRRIAVGVYAYVVDGDGRVVDFIAQGLVLDPEIYREPIVNSGLKFVGRFALGPGDYALRVMVQDNATGNYFMSWSIVSLPGADELSPRLLPPLFPDRGTPWIVARQHGEDGTFAVENGVGNLPSARPTLVENQPAEVYVGGGDWDESAVVGIRIVNELGRTVSEPLARFAGPPTGDFRFRRVTLTPIDLPPGDYSLIVTLSDENASEVMRRAVRIAVVGEGETRDWACAGDPADATDGGTSVEAPEKAVKLSKKEMQVAYRRALLPLGDGDAVTAGRRLTELERRVVADGSRASLLDLGEAEQAEAKALAKEDPSCLMPLALLHRDLYRGYAARHEGLLSLHAHTIAMNYAEQLGRAVPYSGFSEGLMVNFAADLAQRGASTGARDLLERALRLNRGYLPALLSLGFSFERDSDYLDASIVYQRLVDTHPNFEEGRLRLAVNLIRTGRNDAGEEILRGLLGTGTTPWIESIAAQELVRQKAKKAKGLPDAEREARDALERLPGDQRLWILLASILEQTNRHDEAVDVLLRLPPPSRGVSPRARYAEWPALGVRASQAHLSQRASEAVPALRAALVARGGRR